MEASQKYHSKIVAKKEKEKMQELSKSSTNLAAFKSFLASVL